MGALGPAASWIPEDDFLLRRSVEEGASLECLAKGAVQFSRRYTVREIQERWYSLLYDPVISAEASVRMTECERSAPHITSKFSRLGNTKDNKCASGKRKYPSVRSHYYALRKRICSEPLNSENYNYLVGPSNGIQNGDSNLDGNFVLELQESELALVQCAFPHIAMDGVVNTSGAISEDAKIPAEGFHFEQDELIKSMPSSLKRDGSVEFFETGNLDTKPLPSFAPIDHSDNMCSEMEQTHVFNSPILDCDTSLNGLNCSSPLPDMPIWKDVECISMPDDLGLGENDLCIEDALTIADDETRDVDQLVNESYLEEISKSLLNPSSDEELLCMNGDAKCGFEKSYFDGLSSLLLNSPVDANLEVDVPDLSYDLDVSPKTDVVTEDTYESHECLASSLLGSGLPPPNTCDEFVLCVFNMEDPEIPCNDDVVFPKIFSALAKTKIRFQESKSCNSLRKDFSVNTRTHERGPSIPLGHYGLSQAVGSRVSAMNAISQGVGSACETKCLVSNSTADSNLHNRIDPPNLKLEDQVGTSGLKHIAGNSMESAPDGSLNGYTEPQSEELDEFQEIRDLLDSEPGTMDPAGRDSGLGPNYSELEQYESDDDLPSFSDIEAMILDMDLDHDPEFNSKDGVLQYDNDEARRTILRLEKGAYSSIQRAMASHNAFAILYGLCSKHYIKKQEVLLGRETEGCKVDIDLSTEGQFNKISRRQATITLEKNGSFALRNLGKFLIMVNGQPVAPGLSQTLVPNCLIDIRGASFIFDINQALVSQFLDRVSLKSQGQS